MAKGLGFRTSTTFLPLKPPLPLAASEKLREEWFLQLLVPFLTGWKLAWAKNFHDLIIIF